MEKKIDEKMVIIPMEEYETMKKQSDGYCEIRDELKKDAEERGYYVENKAVFAYGSRNRYELVDPLTYEGPMFKVIATKDEVVEKLNEELERLSKLTEEIKKELFEKTCIVEEIRYTRRGRKLLEKIEHKED